MNLYLPLKGSINVTDIYTVLKETYSMILLLFLYKIEQKLLPPPKNIAQQYYILIVKLADSLNSHFADIKMYLIVNARL